MPEVYQRLEEQIDWYEAKSASNKRIFRIAKFLTIIISSAIPLLSPLASQTPQVFPIWGLGALGASVTIIESVLQIMQCHANWIAFRGTSEALKHEKYLHQSEAGPYRNLDQPESQKLLAERVESLVSQENKSWTLSTSTTKSDKG